MNTNLIVSIPQAVSAVATAQTNEGKLAVKVVSIPQAVSAVATLNHGDVKYTLSGVSIPQAVSAVATVIQLSIANLSFRFNTASGKCCCNLLGIKIMSTALQ